MFLGEFVVVYFVFVVLWGFSFDFFVVVGVVGFCFFCIFVGFYWLIIAGRGERTEGDINILCAFFNVLAFVLLQHR